MALCLYFPLFADEVEFVAADEVEFVAADEDQELISMMATLGLPTTFGTSSEVTLSRA